jgi:hypothetical protein
MKRILFVALCSLMVTFTINAQTLSGNEVIDEMLKGANSIVEAQEAELEKQGVKSQISVYFDTDKNQLVMSIRVFNQEVFDIMNVENGLLGSISGMMNAVMAEDNTGNALVWIGNEFKRTNTGMRIDCLYGNRKKTASATADEILETIYKMFQ